MAPPPGLLPALTVVLHDEPVDDLDALLNHKTTRRDLFNRALERARRLGGDEALLLTGSGLVAEGAVHALAAKLDLGWQVPPLACGVLDSLWRRRWLARGDVTVAPLTMAALCQAQAVVMGNAIVGTRPVGRLLGGAGEELWRAPCGPAGC
ncbi:MAG: aminotransferase class IV [Magnetococcus sp. WYHC-3]